MLYKISCLAKVQVFSTIPNIPRLGYMHKRIRIAYSAYSNTAHALLGAGYILVTGSLRYYRTRLKVKVSQLLLGMV